MIKSIISSKTYRILNICDLLVKKNGWTSFHTIQRLNDCSIQTVYDDISTIKEEYSDFIEIELMNKKVKSNNRSHGNVMHLRGKMFSEEYLIRLLLGIYFNPNLNILDYAVELNYSESYLRTQITKANNFLKFYECSIVSNDNKIRIHSKKPFLLEIMIYEIIILSNTHNLINKIKVEQNENYRIVKSFFSKEAPQFITNALEDVYKIHSSHKDFEDNNGVLKSKLLTMKKNVKNIRNVIKEEIYCFNQDVELSIRIADMEKIVDIFVFILIRAYIIPEKINSFVNRYNYFYDSFTDINKTIIDPMNKLFSIIESRVHIDFSMYYPELIFHIYTNILHMRFYKTLNIAVHSDISTAHAQSLIVSYSKFFPMHNFELLNKHKKYSLCLTTSNLKDLEDIENTLLVSDFVSGKDIARIFESIYLT